MNNLSDSSYVDHIVSQLALGTSLNDLFAIEIIKAIAHFFRVYIASFKFVEGSENPRQLCKPSPTYRVCMTFENSPYPRVYFLDKAVVILYTVEINIIENASTGCGYQSNIRMSAVKPSL